MENKRKFISQNSFFQVGIIALVLAAVIAISSRTEADPDLWGHLRFGLDVVESGAIPQFDSYSYLSAGQRWINHEILAEISFAIAWMSGNVTGLILFKVIIVLITLGTIFFYLLKSQIPLLLSGILLLIALFGIQTATGTIRPHMFTVMFTGFLFIILSIAESGSYRWLWAAPPIFALWANFHGGFLAGLGFLGIWAASHTLLHRNKWLNILLPSAASFLAVLINPYGFELIVFLVRTATAPRPEIVEWLPISITTDLGLIYLAILAISILGLLFSRKEKPIPILLLIITASLSPLIAVRHLPLFSLAMVIFVGDQIADARSRIINESSKNSRLKSWMALLSLVIAVFLIIWSYPNFSIVRIPADPVPKYPNKITSLIKDSGLSGNLAVGFNWGEYVIWHLGPEIQVSIDGRRETVYSDVVYADNLSFLFGAGDWDSLLEEYDTQMVLVKRFEPPYNLMKLRSGWELIVEDGISALFASQSWEGFTYLKEFAADYKPPPEDVAFP